MTSSLTFKSLAIEFKKIQKITCFSSRCHCNYWENVTSTSNCLVITKSSSTSWIFYTIPERRLDLSCCILKVTQQWMDINLTISIFRFGIGNYSVGKDILSYCFLKILTVFFCLNVEIVWFFKVASTVYVI